MQAQTAFSYIYDIKFYNFVCLLLVITSNFQYLSDISYLLISLFLYLIRFFLKPANSYFNKLKKTLHDIEFIKLNIFFSKKKVSSGVFFVVIPKELYNFCSIIMSKYKVSTCLQDRLVLEQSKPDWPSYPRILAITWRNNYRSKP